MQMKVLSEKVIKMEKLMYNIDRIYCINLKRRPDRKEIFFKASQEVNLSSIAPIQIFEAIDGGDTKKAAEFGCKESHRNIIKDAKKHNFNYV